MKFPIPSPARALAACSLLVLVATSGCSNSGAIGTPTAHADEFLFDWVTDIPCPDSSTTSGSPCTRSLGAWVRFDDDGPSDPAGTATFAFDNGVRIEARYLAVEGKLRFENAEPIVFPDWLECSRVVALRAEIDTLELELVDGDRDGVAEKFVGHGAGRAVAVPGAPPTSTKFWLRGEPYSRPPSEVYWFVDSHGPVAPWDPIALSIDDGASPPAVRIRAGDRVILVPRGPSGLYELPRGRVPFDAVLSVVEDDLFRDFLGRPYVAPPAIRTMPEPAPLRDGTFESDVSGSAFGDITTDLPIEGARSLQGLSLGFVLDAPTTSGELALTVRSYADHFETPAPVEIIVRRGARVESHAIAPAVVHEGTTSNGYELVYSDVDVVIRLPEDDAPDFAVSVRRMYSIACGFGTYGGVMVDRVEVR